MSAIAELKAQTDKAGLNTITTDWEPGASLVDPIQLPDGRKLIPHTVNGKPIHEIACELLDFEHPERSLFPRFTGLPGTGKSQIGRLVAYETWIRRGKTVGSYNGQPFYGLVELAPGPSADENFFTLDFVPDENDANAIRVVESGFVRAMREGLTVVLDEVNTARDSALLSINGVLDGRLTLHLPALDQTVTASPGFSVCLTYNPGLVGESDIPEAWYGRFPAAFEVNSNWDAALNLLQGHEPLVKAAAFADRNRISGDNTLAWTPQFREIQSLATMTEKLGHDLAARLFLSDLRNRSESSQLIGPAEIEAALKVLTAGGYGHCRLNAAAVGEVPLQDGYPLATTD